jgi:hypothetical protein
VFDKEKPWLTSDLRRSAARRQSCACSTRGSKVMQVAWKIASKKQLCLRVVQWLIADFDFGPLI